LNIGTMLKVALKNEVEATDLAAAWLPSTREIDVKLGFARQVGDESKHYQQIAHRCRELGVDLSGFDPLAEGYSPLYKHLVTLTDTVERVAAGQFTREAIALVKNEAFISYCEEQGDAETARLYRDTIQPDERFHHELGRKLLERYAVGDAAQERARRASRRVLELAEELTALARAKKGLHHAPGC
ncbi:MAG: ferritin-like domain-containing protein, partial [Myxococcales bacterium]|nr:ferritin-like domain-containing protein [Myxococcales bacterium]